MINRVLITSLIFVMSSAGFAGDNKVPSLKSDNNGLCEDTISQIGKFLPRSDWPNFAMGTSSTIDEVNEKLSRAKTFVYLNKDLDTFKKVIESKDKNQLNKVTGFFHPYFTKRVDQNDLISLLANENTRKLVLKEWEKETVAAIEENREPYYLRLISKLEAFKLKKYLDNHKNSQNKIQNFKHAYSVFFSITAYKFKSWEAIWSASCCAARVTFRDAFKEADKNIKEAALKNAKEAIRNNSEAALKDAKEAALKDIRKTLWNIKEAAEETIKNVREATREDARETVRKIREAAREDGLEAVKNIKKAAREDSRETVRNIKEAAAKDVKNIVKNIKKASWNVTSITAELAAEAAFGKSTFDAAEEASRNAAEDAAEDAATDAAWEAAQNAANAAGRETAENTGREAAKNAILEIARNAAMNAIYPAIEQSNHHDIKSLGKFSFRIVEKTVLLHFLDNFEKIVDASYKASIDEMRTIPLDNIFESQAIWKEFKTTYFGEIENDPETYHFQEYWIKKMDGIVETIEGSAEPARKKQKA